MASRRPHPAESASEPASSGPDTAAEARKPGRPRNEDACRAIRDTALHLVVANGFAGVTIESIAERAGVAKATVYRRWTCKAELIVHAFFETVAARVRIQDSGDIRADFRQQLRLVVREMAGPNGRVLATLLACMQMDASLAEAFRTRWLAVRRAEGRSALERGIERGEIARGTDPDFVLDALYSPLHFRLLAGHGPLTTQFSDQIVELVFDGLSARNANAKLAGAAHRSANASTPAKSTARTSTARTSTARTSTAHTPAARTPAAKKPRKLGAR